MVRMLQQASTPPPGQYLQLSCHDDECCAVRMDGNIVCWGGSLDEETPNVVYHDSEKFIQVALGKGFFCGIKVRAPVV
jgi:hypothetical protein